MHGNDEIIRIVYDKFAVTVAQSEENGAYFAAVVLVDFV